MELFEHLLADPLQPYLLFYSLLRLSFPPHLQFLPPPHLLLTCSFTSSLLILPRSSFLIPPLFQLLAQLFFTSRSLLPVPLFHLSPNSFSPHLRPFSSTSPSSLVLPAPPFLSILLLLFQHHNFFAEQQT